MKDVFFYDFDFNLLADIPEIISLNIEKRYCGYGTAEVHFPISCLDVLAILENNQYLFFVSGEQAAIVTGWKVDEDIAVFGRTPEWLLTKRGVPPLSFDASTPEEIARAAINAAANDFVTLGAVNNFGTNTEYKTDKVRRLHDVVFEVLNMQKLGFEIAPDIKNKTFVFSVCSGSESLATISKSYRTGYNMLYTTEKQDAVTMSGWYERKLEDMGEWNAESNLPALTNNKASNAYTYYRITAAGTRFGLSCNKGEYLFCDTEDGSWQTSTEKPENVWIYIKNTSVSGVKRWDAVLNGVKTESEAVAEIKAMSVKSDVVAEVKGVEYGVDYALGDIVRVQLEVGRFKKSEKKRVTSVHIYYDVNKSGVSPTLSSLEE